MNRRKQENPETGELSIKKIQQDNQKFIKASKDNNLDIVKSLVKEGRANVDAVDNDGYTALIWAADLGKTEIVKILKSVIQADILAKDACSIITNDDNIIDDVFMSRYKNMMIKKGFDANLADYLNNIQSNNSLSDNQKSTITKFSNENEELFNIMCGSMILP